MQFLCRLMSVSHLVRFLPFAIVSVLIALNAPAMAMTPLEKAQLEKLDPATRLEQRCDVEAMEQISRDVRKLSVDKVLAYAFSDPLTGKNSIKADGAAFRSGEHWYKLAFDCKTDDDHMSVTSFDYEIGEEVPQDQWDRHYLVP
ncbi:DUF930 domain-containing protein [Ochrobactrum sp. Marseille-Q0166]|nr:DUF930 domain-containing protein [Ochrobactrum sp. Marseille-Q0166]